MTSTKVVCLSLVSFALVVSGCNTHSTSPVEQTCSPGEARSCLCDDWPSGIETCEVDGVSWSECKCTREVGTSVTAEMVNSDTLIVLDRSQSMLGQGFLQEISGILEELVTDMEEFTDFGLMIFPGTNCAPGGSPADSCAVPTEPYVLIDRENGSDQEVVNVLQSWEDNVGVCGATPIAATLEVARTYLNEIDYGTPQMIVLITDGAPNCNFDLDGSSCECTDIGGSQCVSEPQFCLDDVATMAAAEALNEDGIPVYVISLGEEITAFDTTMDAIAQAGGTGQTLTAKALTDVAKQMARIQPELHTCQLAVDWTQVGKLTGDSQISSMAIKTTLWGKGSQETPLGAAQAVFYDPGCTTGSGFDLSADNKINLCSSICSNLKESKIVEIGVTVE